MSNRNTVLTLDQLRKSFDFNPKTMDAIAGDLSMKVENLNNRIMDACNGINKTDAEIIESSAQELTKIIACLSVQIERLTVLHVTRGNLSADFIE